MQDLITDLETIRRLCQEQEDDHIRFRQFLKYKLPWSDRRLDALVHEIAAKVAAAVDCTRCANCCRVLEVSLQDDDLARLAEHLHTTPDAVETEYAGPGEHCPRGFKDAPCRFLQEGRCTVYPARPRDCREYPHLDKTDFRGRMWQVLSNAEDCPIVFNTLQQLKRRLGRR